MSEKELELPAGVISRDLKPARVHARCQPKPDGLRKGWNEWPRPDGGEGGLPYYDITW